MFVSCGVCVCGVSCVWCGVYAQRALVHCARVLWVLGVVRVVCVHRVVFVRAPRGVRCVVYWV